MEINIGFTGGVLCAILYSFYAYRSNSGVPKFCRCVCTVCFVCVFGGGVEIFPTPPNKEKRPWKCTHCVLCVLLVTPLCKQISHCPTRLPDRVLGHLPQGYSPPWTLIPCTFYPHAIYPLGCLPPVPFTPHANHLFYFDVKSPDDECGIDAVDLKHHLEELMSKNSITVVACLDWGASNFFGSGKYPEALWLIYWLLNGLVWLIN